MQPYFSHLPFFRPFFPFPLNAVACLCTPPIPLISKLNYLSQPLIHAPSYETPSVVIAIFAFGIHIKEVCFSTESSWGASDCDHMWLKTNLPGWCCVLAVVCSQEVNHDSETVSWATAGCCLNQHPTSLCRIQRWWITVETHKNGMALSEDKNRDGLDLIEWGCKINL